MKEDNMKEIRNCSEKFIIGLLIGLLIGTYMLAHEYKVQVKELKSVVTIQQVK